MSNSIQDKAADMTNPWPILHLISGVYNAEDEAFGFYHNHIFFNSLRPSDAYLRRNSNLHWFR